MKEKGINGRDPATHLYRTESDPNIRKFGGVGRGGAHVGGFHGLAHPAVKLESSVVVAGGADCPHEAEAEPRLDQLTHSLNFLNGQRRVALSITDVETFK